MQYICMLHFKEDILWSGTDTSYTNMPCMPQEPIVADNQECWIGGWGSTAVIGIPSDELRSRGVRLDNGTECQDQAFYKWAEACIDGEWSDGYEIRHESPSCSNDIGRIIFFLNKFTYNLFLGGPVICPMNGKAVLAGVMGPGGCGVWGRKSLYWDVYSQMNQIMETFIEFNNTLPTI